MGFVNPQEKRMLSCGAEPQFASCGKFGKKRNKIVFEVESISCERLKSSFLGAISNLAFSSTVLDSVFGRILLYNLSNV